MIVIRILLCLGLLLSGLVTSQALTENERILRALLVTGGCCHDYDGQKSVIPTGINQRCQLNIEWTVIHQGGTTTDTKIPLYRNKDWAKGYDIVIHNECFAGVRDAAWVETILKPHRDGVPAIVIHCAMHSYRGPEAALWQEFLGVTSPTHGPHHPYDVIPVAPDHAVMKGLQGWRVTKGELYYIDKVWPKATPLAKARSEATGKYHTTVWVNRYGDRNTRVFGTTIGHYTEAMKDEAYLNLLTRGFLWAVGRLTENNYKPTRAEAAAPPPSIHQPPKGRTSPLPLKGVPSEDPLLKTVSLPDGFRAEIFARPPEVNYPTFVKSTLNPGELYVSVDKNGSLDRAPNRGKIVKARDTDSDGAADQFHDFVPNLDSPRGLAWDGEWLYVMHPPHLSAFRDVNGDHIADESRRLVSGIAFGFKDRPADHTSNGVTLGIDGWLYLAIGDFGFLNAVGADGTRLQFRGGGVVRVRTDGSGLHIYSRGTRNNYEVALSATLEAFTRDNTNDGGGWDIRLHHFTGLENHGYPSQYKHFPEDIIQPLADYGGGSGCGAGWIDDPGWPEGYRNIPVTVDWGRGIFRHEVVPFGATFREITQHPFIRVPSPTDVDLDAQGNLYVASWKNGRFKYDGENIGYVARVRPEGYEDRPVPDLVHGSDQVVLDALLDSRHVVRLQASREALRRDLTDARDPVAIRKSHGIGAATAVLFTQSQAGASPEPLFQLAHSRSDRQSGDTLAAMAVRALDGFQGRLTDAEIDQLEQLIRKRHSPQVCNEAVQQAVWHGLPELAPALLMAATDGDPIIAHTAINALGKLDAWESCLGALMVSDASPLTRRATLKALARMHRPEVVDGLIRVLKETRDERLPGPILTTLTRLYHQEGEWTGRSWGTRPDTTGPYFKRVTWEESPKIRAALQAALQDHRLDQGHLLTELNRNHIGMKDSLGTVLNLAGQDPGVADQVIQFILKGRETPGEALDFLKSHASDGGLALDSRRPAGLALARAKDPGAFEAALDLMMQIREAENLQRPSQDSLFKALVRSPSVTDTYQRLLGGSRSAHPNEAILSWSLLLQLRKGKSLKPEARQAIETNLTEAAGEARVMTALLTAIRENGHFEAKESVLAALDHDNPVVRQAAQATADKLRLSKPKDEGKEPLIANLKKAAVLKEVMARKGNVDQGKLLFTRHGCAACHTVSPEEALKGPYLGNITSLYQRRDLAVAILEPDASIAQGFATSTFEMNDGESTTGFVTREAADEIELRDIAGTVHTLKTSQVKGRTKLKTSMMPAGLMDTATTRELASLLSYLESLNKN